MRKYYQLLLLIVSLLSLTLFLIYRHEYNRLHYVLEVFNFFGQPCNVTDLYFTENTIVQHDWGPVPLWYENDNFYTYSGFWTEKSEAKVIAIHNDSKKSPRNCYLWFDDKKKPVIGKFRYSVMEREQQEFFSTHYYYCSVNEYPHLPYAVSFGSKVKNEDKLNKILLRPNTHKITFNTTMCVVPSAIFNKNEFIEFLSFHTLIGVESFIFYSDNIPYRLQKIIINLSTRLGIKITFFPWNSLNFKDVIAHQVVENDCILRALSDSYNIITLMMNEYIVPSKFHTFKEITELFSNKGRISLPVQAFCIKNTNHRKPIALQNTDVAYYNNNLIREIIRNVKDHNVINVSSANFQIASVHKYIYCTENTERSYPDNSIMKYSTDFIRSTLVQLLLHEQL